MKYIDKFLKKLNASRNTFATYILTLFSIYFLLDRFVEMLFMFFTGVSYAYWGPITYTFALACPVFAYLFSGSSEFAQTSKAKIRIFYVYVIALYTIAVSMFTQWINMGAWLFLISVPNYIEIVTDFSELVSPAFIGLAIYLPLVTAFPVFKWLYMGVNDTPSQIYSLWDYTGISLADKKAGYGPYTCEVFMFKDGDTSKNIVMSEKTRFQSLLVSGGSGTGKTSKIFEPTMAKDLDKKFFFKEVSKEMGFTALKTKIATIKKPYSNEYLNKNFNLNMIKPVPGKETVFKAYMQKMILGELNEEIIYKNMGQILVTPDYEVISHMTDVCDNFGLSYNIIDPSNPGNIGLNPFIYDDASKIAVTISSVLKSMYNNAHTEIEEAYREDVSIHAIENLAILLKEMYPRLNDGALPNLEDMLKMLSNFDLVEKMCEVMANNETLAKKYYSQIAYFKKNFYKTGSGRDSTEQFVFAAVTQLDTLLRVPGLKTILCNRNNNINFDDMLKNGDITYVCTRRGDLGATTHTAFGLFFILSMQNAVLRRPGNETSRIPNFLYIDEFPDYIAKSTEAIFTIYRKYRVGAIIAIQSISQLKPSTTRENYKDTILANCANKIYTGNAPYDELAWWSKEFGTRREWSYKTSMSMDDLKNENKITDVDWKYTTILKEGKLQFLDENNCGFKILDNDGKPTSGRAVLKFMDSKYKEKQKIKTYDFERYITTDASNYDEENHNNKKFDYKNVDFKDENNEFDPIQTDITDSTHFFDNQDAIVVNFKNKKSDN